MKHQDHLDWNNLFKNLIAGFREVLVLDSDSSYIEPRNGFITDAENLKKDVRRVGKDLKKTIERYHG